MNDKKRIITALIILSLLLSIVFINNKFVNKELVNEVESIMTKQISMEEKFKIKGYTLSNPNVMLNPYGNSPLTALIAFETDNEVIPKVTIKGKDELSTIRGEGVKAKEHYIPIYGLYANAENEVILEVEGVEKTIKITTDCYPEDIALPTNVETPDRSKLTNELYFFSPASRGYTSAYDVNGDLRWYLTDDMTWDISRLENGRLLLSTERPINPPYFTTGLYEIDLLGKVYNEYSLPGGYHHDFFEMNNKNLLIASNEFSNELGTVEDIIVEIDRNTGSIVKTWDLKEILNTEDGKSENWSEYDWFHNNSVWFDEKNNEIILSGRHQDAVIAIDYDDGSLQWIIGDPTNWSEEYQKYFFKPINKENEEFEWQWSQHAAMVTPEDYIFILDNGNNKSKIKEEYVPANESYTRGVMYDIDREKMTIKQVWEYGKQRGHEFYSPYISDVDYLGKDHYVVHSGGIVYVNGEISNRPAGFDKNAEKYSTTVELLNDEKIFEITLPTNMYRTEKMSLYNNSTFELSKPNKLGTLGKTEYISKLGLPINAKTFNEIDENINLELTNEEDRLVVEGKFKREQKVNVLLYKNFNIKEYKMRVSKRPYTALCIDIFTPEEDNDGIVVTKNINKEGLNGKYSIYLEIDNQLYNTGKFIGLN